MGIGELLRGKVLEKVDLSQQKPVSPVVDMKPMGVPHIRQTPLLSANTEYEVRIPREVTSAFIRAKDGAECYMSLDKGVVAKVCTTTPTTALEYRTPYVLLQWGWSIKIGSEVLGEEAKEGGLCLYFASPRAGKVIEVVTWRSPKYSGGMEIIQDFSWEQIEPDLEVEETVNDTDKTISVPVNEVWKIVSIRVELSTTATAGNRTLLIILRDSADDSIYDVQFPNHAASTTVFYQVAEGLARETSAAQSRFIHPIPEVELKPSYDLRIYDSAAVADGYDDMVIQMLVKKRRIK